MKVFKNESAFSALGFATVVSITNKVVHHY